MLASVTSCQSTQKATEVQVDEAGQLLSLQSEIEISGVRPHWTTYAHGRAEGNYKTGHECGIGAIMPWGDKLYMVNYAARAPKGSEHKLYIIDKDNTMHVYPGSIGGTPAARMVHKESNQMLIGHYVISADGDIRTISIKEMPGRISGVARHLKDPENMVYYYDMEGMLYEVNIHTLDVKRLYKNPLPGRHGKGAYTSQGKLFLTNNGEHKGNRAESPKLWKVDKEGMEGPEKYGVLATFDGEKFDVVARRQFTDVTTKNGVYPVANEQSPLWAIGWDKRSVQLRVCQDGDWVTYLLPKAAYNNDASHGWFTEWPRIRAISEDELMMDMHGMFYHMPAAFSNTHAKGLKPIGSHLRYIPDFCAWRDQVLLGTDETSIQGNPLTGQPQSNLWLGSREELEQWGPSTGYGAIWLEDAVTKGATSAPYLFQGFDHRVGHFINNGSKSIAFKLQLDKEGNGQWTDYKTITLKAGEYTSCIFPHDLQAEWVRLVAQNDGNITATFHYAQDAYPSESFDQATKDELFAGLAPIDTKSPVLLAKVFDNNKNFNMSYFGAKLEGSQVDSVGTFTFDKYDFTFSEGIQDSLAYRALGTKVHYNDSEKFESTMGDASTMYDLWDVDEASVILHTKNGDVRLPRGATDFDSFKTSRVVRELESERELANIHGTFYELPLSHVGKEPLFDMMRPVASHSYMIDDFNTWNGLLVLTGISADAPASNHIWRKGDAAVWFGGIDDLWKLGKPVGVGGPWKKTAVQADKLSVPYLMTGYDHKELTLSADKSVTVELWLDVAHYTNKPVLYKSFKLKAGEAQTFVFPEGFNAHWAMLKVNKNCTATAQFTYK